MARGGIGGLHGGPRSSAPPAPATLTAAPELVQRSAALDPPIDVRAEPPRAHRAPPLEPPERPGWFGRLTSIVRRHDRAVAGVLLGITAGVGLIGAPGISEARATTAPAAVATTIPDTAGRSDTAGVHYRAIDAPELVVPSAEAVAVAKGLLFAQEPASTTAGARHESAKAPDGRRAWFASDWFVASKGSEDGDPAHNLWAKNGPLHKLDWAQKSETGIEGRAWKTERQVAPGFGLHSTIPRGGALFAGRIGEADYVGATGASLWREAFGVPSGRISVPHEVKGFDFLSSRGSLLGRLRAGERLAVVLDGKVVPHQIIHGSETVIRLMDPYQPGQQLSSADAHRAYFAVVDQYGRELGDRRLDGSMDASWYGNCDPASMAALMFEAPQKDVTRGGVTFTPRDIAGYLTMVVSDLPSNNFEFAGHRYDAYKDQIRLKDGTVVQGEVLSPLGPFKDVARDPKLRGDWRALSSWTSGTIRLETPSGTRIDIPGEKVASALVQMQADIAPWTLKETVFKMVKQGGGIADVDPYARVFNRPFTAAEHTTTDARPSWAGAPSKQEKAVDADPSLRKEWGTLKIHYGDGSRETRYWAAYRGSEPVAYEYADDGAPPPDFLWAPKDGKFDWPSKIERNPDLNLKLVREIYEASITP